MIVFWISLVPSPMSKKGASRKSRSISYSLEYPYPPWMRNESAVTSKQYSLAKYLAMPASTSLRLPSSLSRAALTIIRCAASTFVAISASLKAMAWWSAICRPKVWRCCAYAIPSSKARIMMPHARAATLTRPTSTPSIIW